MRGGFMKPDATSLIFLGSFLGILLLSSCQKGSGDQTAQIRHRTARTQVGPGTGLSPGSGQSSDAFLINQPSGRVYVDSQYSREFNGFIKSLISVTLDPEYVGLVDPVNGVSIKGYIEFDNQGRMLPSQSQIQIEIRDEFTGQTYDGQVVPSILIRILGSEGYATNGQFHLQFLDDHGVIILAGSYQNGGQILGTLSFKNNNNTEGEGVSFAIQTCQFFKCQ
jgi:hypothetical protein